LTAVIAVRSLVAAPLFALVATIAGAEGAGAQDQDPLWRVLKHDVACRDGPSPSALIVAELRFAEVVETLQENISEDREWLEVTPGRPLFRTRYRSYGGRPRTQLESCWVLRNFVSPHARDDGREGFLRAVADLVLSDTTPYDTDDYLRLLNQFAVWKEVVDSSPVLRMREYTLISRVVDRMEGDCWFYPYGNPFRSSDCDPMTLNWIYSQGDLISPTGPEGDLEVAYEHYDALYLEYANHPDAEELLWGVARAPSPTAPEHCSFICIWDNILTGEARYWTEYPNGRYVAEAISNATETVDFYFRWTGCETSGGVIPNFGAESLRTLILATDVLATPEAEALRARLTSALEVIEGCTAGS